MMMMMLIEKVGEVFRRPCRPFNNLFISFLKHLLGFTRNRDDQNDEDLTMRNNDWDKINGGCNGDIRDDHKKKDMKRMTGMMMGRRRKMIM